MKLKYTFEMMEMDDEFVAVPVGDNASELHGIVKLNSTGAEILKMVQNNTATEEIVSVLSSKYNSPLGLIQAGVLDFLHQLVAAGLMV